MALINHHDPVTVLAVTAGMVAVTDMYVNFGPSLADLRSMEPDDVTGRQNLLDKNILIGATVFAAGAYASFMLRSWLPLIGLLAVFAFNAYWHQNVLASANEHVRKNEHGYN